jgi:hypothetical protein
MLLQPKTFVEPDTFFCRGYNKRLPIFICMNNYVDANALRQSDKPCHGCQQGQDVRLGYAQS